LFNYKLLVADDRLNSLINPLKNIQHTTEYQKEQYNESIFRIGTYLFSYSVLLIFVHLYWFHSACILLSVLVCKVCYRVIIL